MSYTHLTKEERYQIYILKRAGHSQSEMTAMPGRDKSTISRELARNHGRRGYRAKQAQALAVARQRVSTHARFSAALWAEVERLLALAWSPEQIARRLKDEQDIRISHEWIYRHVWVDKRRGDTLYRHLRCQKLRRIRFKDPETGKTMVFLTNLFGPSALTICALYKAHW